MTLSDTILYPKKEQNSIRVGGGILSLLSKLERNDRKQEGNVYFHNFPKKEKFAFCEVTDTDRKVL